jgi:hypothetical protein
MRRARRSPWFTLAVALAIAIGITIAEGDAIDAEEHKGAFQPVPEPPKAAGYAPVEPVGVPTELSSPTGAPEA